MTREQVAQVNEEAIMLGSDDSFGEAILGMTTDGCVVYDIDKLVDCFMKRDGMDWEDASEWVSYNCVGMYAGEFNPIYVQSPEETE
jgi:hypothetical protein